MEPVKIVLRHLNGRIVKGYTQDFNPNASTFHVRQDPTGASGDKPIDFRIGELKAIFFVKTFEGNRAHSERRTFVEEDKVHGRKVEVTFIDGELIQGSTMGYDPKRPGFFLFPPDPESNNIRVFVVSAAVKSFRYL
jgi:hypothetical protein